jgi:hypothetical protein
MAAEHRKSTRRFIRQGGRVALTDGSILATCQVSDVSVTGARLTLRAPIARVPDNFILLLSYDGHLRRHCSVVWRSRNSVGVEFVADCPIANNATMSPVGSRSGLGNGRN